jgi:predicted DNA-binding WGR domain protein
MKGMNSFYALQLLEEDNGNKWYVFRKWGRVGTTIGGNKLEPFSTKAAAKKNFEKLYYEKTLNEWSNRKSFVKQPGKFYPIELDFGMKKDEEEIKEKEFDKSKSKLDQRLASLIELMFDTKYVDCFHLVFCR